MEIELDTPFNYIPDTVASNVPETLLERIRVLKEYLFGEKVKDPEISPLVQKNVAHLTVEKVSPGERQQLIKVVEQFKKITEQKFRDPKNSVPEEHLNASFCINSCILQSLKNNHSSEEIYCCRDFYNRVQGLIVLKKTSGYVYINYLYTSPDNLLNSPNRISGVGTRLIQQAAQIAIQENTNQIRLCALDNAKPFYEKLGFKEQGFTNSYIRTISYDERLLLQQQTQQKVSRQYNSLMAAAA